MDAGNAILGLGGFASAGMLLWGLAAVAPLLIHLWSRRRYQTVPWAAMQQLLAAMRQHARRWRIEQWVLLCLRSAILLLAAIAWADPNWSRTMLRTGVDVTNTHYVFVLDVSYSMGARSGQRTRFDEARQRAIEMVRAARQGDGFTLVLLGQGPQVILADPTFDPDTVIEELQSQQVLHAGGDLGATLSEVERLIDHAGRSYPRLQRQRVAILTDLGRTTWGAVETATVQSSLSRLAEKAELSLMDVGQAEPINAAVTRMEIRDSLVVTGRELTLEVEIQSFASRDLPRRIVEFGVDGQPAGEREIDVPAGARVTVSFSPRLETPGDHTLEVRLREDDLETDNSRWLVLAVRERIRVLCIEGKPGEARFVALALDPASSSGSGLRIVPEIAGETVLAERNLDEFDVIVLCNVGRFDAAEAGALRRFVMQGGGLAVFVGDQVHADSYHQLLGPNAKGETVLPARLGRVAADAGDGINPLGYRHPLAAPFRGQIQAGLVTTPVWRYMELKPYDPEETRTALALASGAPLVVDGRLGRGRCLLFATAASPESIDRSSQPPSPWTALPAWPSFVPLVQESLQLLVASHASNRNVDVGQPLVGQSDARRSTSSLEIAGPVSSRSATATPQRIRLTDEDDHATWTFQPPHLSGLYEVRETGADRPEQWFAVNVLTAESDLSRLDAELLPAALTHGTSWEAAETDGMGRAARFPWFRVFLVLVLGLMIAETCIAWQFGARSR